MLGLFTGSAVSSLPVLAQVAEAVPDASTDLTPQWIAVVGIFVTVYLAVVVSNYFTRAGVIARATIKEAIRQPFFLLLLLFGTGLNVVNTFLPVYTFGEDIKMMMDCGLMTLIVSGLLMAAWTASTSVAQEIEGKTAMTLLSKPIHRWQFILGKYSGILQSVLALLVPMTIILLLLIYYKVAFDAAEKPGEEATTATQLAQVVEILPSVLLVFFEVAVLTSVSVMLSTRLPMIVNIVTTFAIFVIGHITPSLLQSGALRLEVVEFMARFIATVFPSLESFNTQTAIATGATVVPEYIGYSALYCLCYAGAMVLLALILFEDRDLA